MSFTTNEARYRIWAQTLNLVSDTLKLMLASASYTPDRDHIYVSSVNPYELSGTGYTGGFAGSGRKTVASKALVKDDTNDLVKLTCADTTWAAINAGTIRYAIVIKEITNDAASLVVAVIDINPSLGIVTDGSDWVLRQGANGLFDYTSP